MKTALSVTVVATALLTGAIALSQSPWRERTVTLGWTKQPSPDETGTSTAQKTKLLGKDELTYSRSGGVETYELEILDERNGLTVVRVFVPKGAAVNFSGTHCDLQGTCERYHVNRADGAKATVEFATNAPPEPPVPTVPNSGLVVQ